MVLYELVPSASPPSPRAFIDPRVHVFRGRGSVHSGAAVVTCAVCACVVTIKLDPGPTFWTPLTGYFFSNSIDKVSYCEFISGFSFRFRIMGLAIIIISVIITGGTNNFGGGGAK